MCTLGPATSSERRIRELVYAGMDVARLNMSHGSHDDHADVYRLVREASDASGRGVGILADLQGPKIRLERFADGYAEQSMQMTRAQNPDMTEAERVVCEMEFEITQSTLFDYLESQRSDDPDKPTFSVIEGGKRD